MKSFTCLSKLGKKLGALTDSVPRIGEGDKLLVERRSEPEQQRRAAHRHRRRADGLEPAEDRRRHPQRAHQDADRLWRRRHQARHRRGFARQAGDAHRERHFAERDDEAGALPLPGCAHAEKRGTFTNTKGRVQKFMKAVEPPGDARPEWEFLHELVFNVTGQNGFVSIEGLFNQMAKEVPAFNGLTWAGLGDTGRDSQI